MNTKFNVGDTVYLEVKVKEINIDGDGTAYEILFKNRFGNWNSVWVKEDQINAEA